MNHCLFRLRSRAALAVATTALCSLPNFVSAQTAPAGTVQPAPQIAKGQVERYFTFHLLDVLMVEKNARAQSNSISVQSTLRYKALEANPDGSLVLSVFSEGGTITRSSSADGKTLDESPLPAEPEDYPRRVTLDKRGKILSIEDKTKAGGAADPFAVLSDQTNLIIQTNFVPLPDHPVKIGDKWTATYPTPGSAAGKTGSDAPPEIRVECSLLGQGPIFGADALKIREEFTIPFETDVDSSGHATTGHNQSAGRMVMRLAYSIVAYVLPKEGLLLGARGKITGSIKFTGEIVKSLPVDEIRLTGSVAVSRVTDGKPAQLVPPEPEPAK